MCRLDCALILFIQTLALYKSFTYVLTYLLILANTNKHCCTVVRLNIQVSQVSAAKAFRRDGGFYSIFFCSSSQNARVNELLQESRAVLIYRHEHKK